MKKLGTKILAFALGMLMVASAFAALPISAKTLDSAEQSTLGDILWFQDFEGSASDISGGDAQAWLLDSKNGDTMWISGSATSKTAAPNVGIKASGAMWHSSSKALYNVYQPDTTPDNTADNVDNTFNDLMLGRTAGYTDATNYFVEFDYTPQDEERPTNSIYLGTGTTTAPSVTANYGTETVNGTTRKVRYSINSLYRGPSYFTPQLKAADYDYLFKVCAAGYIYSTEATKDASGSTDKATRTFNSSDNSNWAGFTYTKQYYDETAKAWKAEVTEKPITQAAVNEMIANYGDKYTSGINISSWSGNAYHLDKAFKIAWGETYNIRFDITLNADNTKATYKVYVREDTATDEGGWFYLGTRTKTILKGQTKQNNDNTYGDDEYPYSVRLIEDSDARSIFDNMVIATYGTCSGDRHVFPIVQSSDILGGVELVDCKACGKEYYVYKNHETVLHGDFENITSAEYNAFASNIPSKSGCDFVEGKGINYTGSNSKMWISSGITDKSPFVLTLKTNFTQFPTDFGTGLTEDGSSLLTLMTGATSGFNIYARMGRNADGGASKNSEAADSTGWIKLRHATQLGNWSDIAPVEGVKLNLNQDYVLSFCFYPEDGKFDFYLDGVYKGTGSLGVFPTTSSNLGYPAFRIGDGLSLKMTLKEYKLEKLNDDIYTYDVFEHTSGYNFDYTSSMPFNLDTAYGDILGENVSYDTETAKYSGNAVIIKDTNKSLVNTPYTVSFDFMIRDGGFYRNENHTAPDYLSLISWITNDGSITDDTYGSMVRVGAVDTQEDDDNGLDKYFLVMNRDYVNYVTADTGYQSYTSGSNEYFYTDTSAVYYITPGEWITVSLSVDPFNKAVYLYVNDALVGQITRAAYSYVSGALTKSNIRIGDNFRKIIFPWAVRDIRIDVTPDEPLTNSASGEIFHADFGKQINSYGFVNGNIPALGATSLNLGAAVDGITGITRVSDSESEEGYSRIVVNPAEVQNGATNLFNLSTSVGLADGSFYNYLEGKKYSIEVSYAINKDRASLNDAEKAVVTAANKALTDNGKKAAYTESFVPNSITSVIIRLSKYFDGNSCHVVKNSLSGLILTTTSGDIAAYDKNGTRLNGFSSFDENGKPENGFLTVKVVVDEETNTYTAYANGELIYYKDSANKLVPAASLAMAVVAKSGSLVYNDKTWDGFYSSIPHVDANGNTHSGNWANTSYVRFFQNTYDFSVQDIKIEKVDKVPEYIGSQVKMNSDSASTSYDVRFVLGVDDIYVHDIEYDIVASSSDGTVGETKTVSSLSMVYSSIVAETEKLNAYKFDEGKYFSVFSVTDIPLADEKTVYTFEITPYTTAYNPTLGKTVRDVMSGAVTYTVKYNGEGEFVEYSEKKNGVSDVSMNYQDISTLNYKALGRTQMLDGALVADWSAAGIEFSATCMGEVYVNIASSSLFTITVDAENDAYGSVRKDVKLGTGRVPIASNLPYGKYRFKIENQTGYSNTVDIKGAAVFGKFEEAPADSTLLIEFIGDSITHGCGLGSADYSQGTNDGTLTYAYLAAKGLAADYTIMANGGMGVLWGSDYTDTDLNRSMKKYPYLNDSKRTVTEGEGEAAVVTKIAYEAPRQADLVVIGLSTNDNYRFSLQYNAAKTAYVESNPEASADEIAAYMEEWKGIMLPKLGDELEILIKEIEKNHGTDVPIIFARGMMEKDDALYLTAVTYMTDLIENQWKGKYGDHVIKVAHLTPDRLGASEHPTREGAAKQGQELEKFIRENFSTLVPNN